jgi:hypothetical protein
MIPNIFISSTIHDLSHLRDSIRDLILELGYNPIMSEYGEIGFLPSESAEQSCYLALRDCQLSIVIIGKRYGSISENGLSITHNEFRTTRDKKIPVIFLVDAEVMSFKRVFDVNEYKENLTFPGMENPSKIFQLIREFSESKINNGLISFTNAQSAKNNLKKQLAHILGELLRKHFDSVPGEIKDILSEITTLRHILLKNEKDAARKFAIAFRFLLEEENYYLKEIIEMVSISLEEGVAVLIEKKTFSQFLEFHQVDINIVETSNAIQELEFSDNNSASIYEKGLTTIFYSSLPYSTNKTAATFGADAEYNIKPVSRNDKRVIIGIGSKHFYSNENGKKLLDAMCKTLQEAIEK